MEEAGSRLVDKTLHCLMSGTNVHDVNPFHPRVHRGQENSYMQFACYQLAG